MSKKVKRMIYIVCILWVVVFAQMITTRLYVQNQDVTQAFARNRLVVRQSSTSLQKVCKNGGTVMGTIPGRLTKTEKQQIVKSLYGYEGGTCLYEKESEGYYVSYGFTNGIPMTKKVGGMNINMNIAITYDENEDKSMVYLGVPMIEGDY